jgi:hypothetical protein
VAQGVGPEFKPSTTKKKKEKKERKGHLFKVQHVGRMVIVFAIRRLRKFSVRCAQNLTGYFL